MLPSFKMNFTKEEGGTSWKNNSIFEVFLKFVNELSLFISIFENRCYSRVTGLTSAEVRFQDFWTYWSKLRKKYGYCSTFLTINIDLSMKYKEHIRFHYEM